MKTENLIDLRIIIDTSSLMHPYARDVFQRDLVPIVCKNKIPFVIPYRVIEEIKKHVNSHESTEEANLRREYAKSAMDIINEFKENKYIEIYGDADDSFADNIIQVVVTRFNIKYNFLVITQDRALAMDILDIGLRRSVQGKKVAAYRIFNGRKLVPWEPENVAGKNDSESPASILVSDDEKYRLCDGEPRMEENTRIDVGDIPTVGEFVWDEFGHRYLLKKMINAGGGEGIVYWTHLGNVCKIFKKDRLTRLKIEKIRFMLQKPIGHPFICWPKSLIYNKNKLPIGYIMNEALGRELQTTIFIKPRLIEAFPNWRRRELVTLAISILELISHLHERNILLGDINPRNIMFKDEKTVFLVDTDSYQIENFPCPVGMPPFLAPRLLGKSLNSTLRTLQDESFAIATLVFMILLPGKPPYSHTGGTDPAKNVSKKHFPYPLGEKRGHGVPDGPWKYIWSHLPYKIKELFIQSFEEEIFINVNRWIHVLNIYISNIDKNYIINEIFPKYPKMLSKNKVLDLGGIWEICPLCKNEHGHFGNPNSVCKRCEIDLNN